MSTILDDIVARNRPELEQRRRLVPLAEVRRRAEHASPRRPYRAALAVPGLSFIAEIKRASPSKGVLRPDLDPTTLARSFEVSGCACLSILTERHFFRGELAHLGEARDVTTVPLLRKDFLVDPYQIYEARAAGADAALLIVTLLDDEALRDLIALLLELGMAAQVEVHDADELQRALRAGADLLGVNNRDLRDFTVDLGTTERLMPWVPPGVLIVSESGIQSLDDVKRIAACGVDAVHIGEALMKAADPGEALGSLIAASRPVVGAASLP